MTKFKIFVYHEDWPQKPFSKPIEAYDITEAVDKLVRTLDDNVHLCSKDNGEIWYYTVDK